MTAFVADPPATFPVIVPLTCVGGHQWFVQGAYRRGSTHLADNEHGPFCPACFALAVEFVHHDPAGPAMPALMPVLMRLSWREQFVGTPEGLMLHRDVVAEFGEQG